MGQSKEERRKGEAGKLVSGGEGEGRQTKVMSAEKFVEKTYIVGQKSWPSQMWKMVRVRKPRGGRRHSYGVGGVGSKARP